MGADCCGGGPPPSNDTSAVGAVAAAVDGLSVSKSASASPTKAQKKADAAAAAASARPHSEYVADLQAFLAKRIELFEQYRKRDVDKVNERKRGRESCGWREEESRETRSIEAVGSSFQWPPLKPFAPLFSTFQAFVAFSLPPSS